jgi:hypothetical protein
MHASWYDKPFLSLSLTHTYTRTHTHAHTHARRTHKTRRKANIYLIRLFGRFDHQYKMNAEFAHHSVRTRAALTMCTV